MRADSLTPGRSACGFVDLGRGASEPLYGWPTKGAWCTYLSLSS
jgi:hypothetical protein